MENPKKGFNIFASLTGLMLTGSTVFMSASSAARPVATPTKHVLSVTQTPAVAVASASSAPEPVSTQTPIKTQTQIPSASSQPSAKVATNTSGYTDGSYTAAASYDTPGSVESINITLTLQNGIVSNASISQSGQIPESRRYQNVFAAAYRQYVVGKSIKSLGLSRVSGASLTTGGFNDALAQIKTEARA